MNIRHRITMLVVLSFLAIALIGGYAVLQSRENAAQVKTVTEGVVPSALATSDLVSQLKDVQLAMMSMISSPDDNLASQAKDKLQAQKQRLQAAIDLQLKQAESDTQRGLVQQAKESLGNYFASIDQTARFKLDGQKDIAEATFYGEVSMYQNELAVIIETLRIEKNRVKDGAIANLNQSLAETVKAISGATVVIVLLLGVLGALLYRQITRPISRMQAMMSEIAASQDFTRRVPVDQEDEIGRSIMAFNSMLARIQESSLLLRQKTCDMQTMLQNMPQGILTIVDGNKVHHEYSAYLETIFETQDIADRDMMELVFSSSNLGADVLSQIQAIGGACIGEDLMNFEFNEHLMVGEIEKTMADGRVKILDLNWSPISDDNGTTVRLMLCVRDATELRKLAAEANEQKRELEIIGEILAVNPERFQEFILGSIKFIDKNELLIRQHQAADADTITQLFRNMHTIKGNARTYGLQHLTNVVHEAEQTCEELHKPRPKLAWDQGTLLAELAGVKAAVERYARINEVSLGRKGAGRRGNAERYLLVDKAQIHETLHRLETVNTGNLHELVAARDAVRNILRLLGTEPIDETLGGVIESLPALARELGKEPPIVEIEDNGYVIRNQASSLLKNVFMHLIRNAMDHGLEAPVVRAAQGKLPTGVINLEVQVAARMLQIRLGDDGRGLALARIRQLAVARGLLANSDQFVASDEAVAALIFQPGFSTAEKVTDISGRGVGMDAVQDFVRREHGKIEIQFIDSAVGADFRQFQTVVYLPEDYAVHVDGVAAQHLTITTGEAAPAAAGEGVHVGAAPSPGQAGALPEAA